jgi:hypothetical protein
MKWIGFILLTASCLMADDNAPRVVRLRGFQGLWLSPIIPLDRGDALSHWRFDEAILNDRADSADSKTLAEQGGVPSNTGKITNSADFSGGGSFLQNVTFYDPGDSDFSFSGWVWFNAHDSAQVPMQRATDSQAQYQLESDGTNLRWGVSSNGTAINTWVVSTVPITNAVWIFVVAYHDSVNNVIGISVNNETVVTAAHGGGVSTAAANGLRFGIRNSTGGSDYFNGRTDSFTYWKRRLSAFDISRLWNNGNGLDYPFP